MQKPVKIKNEMFDYFEIIDFIEKKYNINTTDFADSSSHFYKWCNLKGYGIKDAAGKDRGSSQIWYKEYQSDPEGDVKRPPYLNFWHWLLEQYSISNGGIIEINILELLEESEPPEFVKIILNYIQDEFGAEFECITKS